MLTDKVLIFANGELNDGPMVERTLAEGRDALVICADGGALLARHFGFEIDLVVGDMDSIDPALLAALEAAGTSVERHPVHKNETDLELALQRAVERGGRWIRGVGAIGGRVDQTLSNIYLCALPILDGCDVRLVAGKQETRLLTAGEWTVEGDPGDTVSLIPLSGIARGVTTTGLYYPLRDEDLLFGPARGVSNVMQTHAARVSLRDGVLLMIHTIGKA